MQGDAAALAGRLQAAGVLPANVLSGLVEAYVPVSLLPWVARLPGVTRVVTIVPPQPDYGSVVTEGAAVHNTPNWNAFGYTGAGVKVGIIDVGFAGYSSLQGTEVPVPAAVRCYATMGNPTSNFNNCQTTTQHGVAVAETIMDEAPGVSLYLANPFSYGDLVTTAQWMVSQGVQVINHSVGWTWDGPGDGTSPDPNQPRGRGRCCRRWRGRLGELLGQFEPDDLHGRLDRHEREQLHGVRGGRRDQRHRSDGEPDGVPADALGRQLDRGRARPGHPALQTRRHHDCRVDQFAAKRDCRRRPVRGTAVHALEFRHVPHPG